jgi:hypothetical protein
MSKMSNYSVTMWDFEGCDNEVGEAVYEERMAFLEEMIDKDQAESANHESAMAGGVLMEDMVVASNADVFGLLQADEGKRRAYAAQFKQHSFKVPELASSIGGIEFFPDAENISQNEAANV